MSLHNRFSVSAHCRQVPARAVIGVLFFLCAALLSAFGGIRPYLPDSSGEYVIYRDYTFQDETYIGFLYYDESTLGAVSVSPEAGKTVSLLLTLDPDSDFIDITGERIVSDIVPEDTYIVNHLHDVLYELAAARKEANGSGFPRPVTREQTVFSVPVTAEYEYYIPLFNLLRMKTAEGTPILELERMGRLENSGDPSFFEFEPLPSPLDPEVRRADINSAAPVQKYTADNLTITLDGQWAHSGGNIWFLGGSAMIWTDITGAGPEFFAGAEYTVPEYLVRIFSLSGYDNWSQPQLMKFSAGGNATRLENVFYNPENNTEMRDIKIFLSGADGTVKVFALTAEETVYQAHKAYFDGILAAFTEDN